MLSVALDAGTAAPVPAPFEPLVVRHLNGAVEVVPWGRTYRFDAGPLPSEIRSSGSAIFAQRARFLAALGAGEQEIVWRRSQVISAAPDLVRIRTTGSLPGLQVYAITAIEYDGMISVDLRLTALQPIALRRLSYHVDLAPQVAQFYTRHLRYDPTIENVVKTELLQSAGPVPASLAFDFLPTLALGNRSVGIEWWSETNVHWSPRPGMPSFEVTKGATSTRLSVTPIRTQLNLAPKAVWRDSFDLFVFPTRPPPERWRSTRFLSYAVSPNFDRTVGSRLVNLATQNAFHAQYDGLPGSIDDTVQRTLRSELQRHGVDYMPYGMLMIAPLMHPRMLSNYEIWAASRWWKIQPGDSNPVLDRNHPSLTVGDVYTYPACAGRSDYFDWLLAENLRALRTERLDAFYFDQGAITRMCKRSPTLVGTTGREVWEYRNVRRFYKRLYEALKAEAPNTLIVMHSNGAAKALGAFIDFQMSGEALNEFFGGGNPASVYFTTPLAYRPHYHSLPPGYLDAQLFPRVGGLSTLLPQIKWAIDPTRPARARAFQRGFHAITLVNDIPAPLWFSDSDTSLEIYLAIDRFGDIGNATLHPWWSNGARIRRPSGLQVSAWVDRGRALLVAANPGATSLQARVELDPAALGVPGVRRYRDLERPSQAPALLSSNGFEVQVSPHDLRIFAVE